jgi:copper transport protein
MYTRWRTGSSFGSRAGGRPGRRPGVRRALMATVAVLLGLVWGVALPARPALAHAGLVGTAPANGESLAAAPTEILLRFTEPVVPVPDGIALVDADGVRRHRQPARVVPGAPRDVVLPVPTGLGDGVYTVTWRVISADSHPLHGAFVFGVGEAALAALPDGGARTDGDPAVAAAFWLFRVLGYLGLAALGGGLLFLLVCWPRGWSRRRTRRLLLGAWCVGVVSAVGVLLLQGPYSAGGTLADLGAARATLASDYGVYVLMRLGLLLVGGALVLARDRLIPAPAADPAAAAVLGVALPVTWTGTGHANAYQGVVPVLVDTVHLVAMAAWIGGLILLAVGVLPRSAGHPVRDVAVALTRFSRVATVAVVALVVTGVFQAWRGLGSWAALPGSAYGTLLVFKLALIGVLLWFGAMSRAAVRRRYLEPVAEPLAEKAGSNRSRRRAARVEQEDERRDRRLLHRFVRAEAAVVVVVIGVTSLLVATPPGQRSDAPPVRLAQAPTFVAELPLDGGGRLRVELNPARVGPSRLAVRVLDAGGRDWDVPEVSGSFVRPDRGLGPLRVTLDRSGPGRYASRGLTLPMAGPWELRLSVRTSEIDATTASTQLSIT